MAFGYKGEKEAIAIVTTPTGVVLRFLSTTLPIHFGAVHCTASLKSRRDGLWTISDA
jgi:hypothetical protein